MAQDLDTVSGEEDFEAWMAYRKAKRAKKEGGNQGKREKSFGGERTKNPINRRTGGRNRCYTCNSEYFYAPQCPQKENWYSGTPSPLRTNEKPPNKPYSSIAMKSPVEVGSAQKLASLGPERKQEQSFSTTIKLGAQLAVSPSESVVILGTRATANSVCYRWLENHNVFLGQ